MTDTDNTTVIIMTIRIITFTIQNNSNYHHHDNEYDCDTMAYHHKMMPSDELSRKLTETLGSRPAQRGDHPSSQNYCVPPAAEHQSHVGGPGNAGAADRPCDGRRTPACHDECTCWAAGRSYVGHRRSGYECAAPAAVGTSSQTASGEAARRVLHDLCWCESNPTHSQHPHTGHRLHLYSEQQHQQRPQFYNHTHTHV